MSNDYELDPMLFDIFTRELLHQWDYAATAIGLMNQSLAALSQGPAPQAMDQFWFAVDAALGAIGNISKIFWPSGGKPSEATLARCAWLRNEFGLTETSLLQDRAIRNGFEHFDE